MKTMLASRYVLSVCVAAVSLTSCGVRQSPLGVPAATPAAIPATSAQYAVLLRFKGGRYGEHPESGLIDVDGTLYGSTYDGGSASCPTCGTIYGVTTSGAEKVLHGFAGYPSDGAHPLGDLLDVNWTLYGTTFSGGVQATGTFYSVSLSGDEKVLVSFAYDGTDNRGLDPAAGVINAQGTLYGTTEKGCGPSPSAQCGPGSTESYGVVYSVTTTGTVKVLYSFDDGGGVYPHAPVTDVDGMLYGTTLYGGSKYYGVVYRVSTSSGEHTVHNFTGGYDGQNPASGLLDVNGTLYGTTQYGGGGSACAKGCGTIFSISTSGAEKVLHAFAGGSDGAYPRASLIEMNGALYGTTAAGGGASGCTHGWEPFLASARAAQKR